MDVCNGINSPTRYYHNAEFISECFRKLGPWIASCHAKDLAWIPEMNVHLRNPGQVFGVTGGDPGAEFAEAFGDEFGVVVIARGAVDAIADVHVNRSEERRVGKGCRCWC